MALTTEDSKFIKKPNQASEFNDKEMDELIKCSDPVNGPIYFMENFIWARHPTRGMVRFIPYPYQREMVKQFVANRKQIVLTGRQMGKCLDESTMIRVRNKETGEILEISIGEFHERFLN